MLLVVGVTLFISFFLPKNKGKLFHYEEGKPWLYGQLIAKFDFPIFKTEETIKQERDSILKPLYFYLRCSFAYSNRVENALK